MSGYTIGEILLWLLLAGALGFVLGWLARELVLRRRPLAAEPPAEVVLEPAVLEPAALEPAVVAGPHPGSALPTPGGEPPSPDFVVKVSRGSKIYHAPTSPAYGRTTAALWFTSTEAAEAAGFRKPKNA
jgi:hypothetical protein